MDNFSDPNQNNTSPLEFLHKNKSKILMQLTYEMGFTGMKALESFIFLTELILRLKNIRLDKSMTLNFLEESIGNLPHNYQIFIESWLITSLNTDDYSQYAIDSLEKFIDRNPHHKIPLTFKTYLNDGQLMLVRSRLINPGIIGLMEPRKIGDIDDSDFRYLFSNKTVYPGMPTINWLESRSSCHELLSKTVYVNPPFDFIQANNCISFLDGKKIDSNDKSRGMYKNLDSILQF